MDVKTAAIQVLQQAGTALHAKDIAEQIMAAGLWQSEGKTPDATVSARLYSDIKSNGDKSPFVKVGPQTFALRDSAEIPSGAVPVPATVEEAKKLQSHPLQMRVSLSPIALRRCLRSSAGRIRCTTRKSPRKPWRKDPQNIKGAMDAAMDAKTAEIQPGITPR
jgi:hypothetical protein